MTPTPYLPPSRTLFLVHVCLLLHQGLVSCFPQNLISPRFHELFRIKANPARNLAKSSLNLQGRSISNDQTGAFNMSLTEIKILEKLGDNTFPFPNSNIEIDPGVTYRSDFQSISGCELYQKECQHWIRLMQAELPELRSEILSSTVKKNGNVEIQWKIGWIPFSLQWMVNLGRNWPNLKITHVDILDKIEQEARFSWKALGLFFGRILFEGELRIPIAVITGVTTFVFDLDAETKEASSVFREMVSTHSIPRLVSHSEVLHLTTLFDKGRVKNRRIAVDFQTFLDTRRPSRLNENDWANEVNERIVFSRVPGMGMFDIDGLEEKDRVNAYANAQGILLFSTLMILSFGIVNAIIYFPLMQKQQGYQELLNTYLYLKV